jgi:hypothetical protein
MNDLEVLESLLEFCCKWEQVAKEPINRAYGHVGMLIRQYIFLLTEGKRSKKSRPRRNGVFPPQTYLPGATEAVSQPTVDRDGKGNLNA